MVFRPRGVNHRLLVIDFLDTQGQPDRLRLPLYDVLLGDAEAVWALLIGSLRLLGAAYAEVVEFIADGAAWIWHRVERLSPSGRDSRRKAGGGP